MSIERLRNRWLNVRSSLWFIPSILTTIAFLLSFAIPEIDKRIEGDIARHRGWLFFGTADAARTILSVIAGSLITVITLLFSITILTVQQASTQYTPRVIRSFTRDRPSQIVLGTYLATFLYCILVLRQVRSQTESDGFTQERFVPVLSISFAIVLTILCLGMLVYFIHHIATLFQASTVIERVHHDLLRSIQTLYPDAIGGDMGVPDDTLERFRERYVQSRSVAIRAREPGFLRTIDDAAIEHALDGAGWIVLHPRVGTYITNRQLLADVDGARVTDEALHEIRSAFVVDEQRTLEQDNLFGIRQLVDIALKALSPSIHDPTTAEHAVSCLGDVLICLGDRSFPERTRIVPESADPGEGGVAIWTNRPEFRDYVDASFGQIRRVARENVHVTAHVLIVLAEVGRHVSGERAEAIRAEVNRIIRQIDQGPFDPDDRDMLRAAALDALRAIDAPAYR